MTTVKEGFDPFGEEYVPDVAQIVSVPRLKSTCSIQQVDFNYQKYLIVFTYLSKAVDAMVDALETLKESALDIQVLAELTKCGDISAEKFQSSPKKLVQPEGYGTETTMLLVNDPYFHNLLDNHLNKNQHTKEYIVEGRRKISREENMQPNSPGTADCVSLNSWLSKSHESITESIKSKISAGVQTTEIDDDFKESLNDLRRNVPYVTSASSSSSEKLSHDNFYFVNDEEVLDEKKPTI